MGLNRPMSELPKEFELTNEYELTNEFKLTYYFELPKEFELINEFLIKVKVPPCARFNSRHCHCFGSDCPQRPSTRVGPTRRDQGPRATI
ncbi:hypothetical protein EVAR_21949_1 [Eumeta japonica]|uniref:Uncharacterized protein n=1 Tax=Eumeta variegata TaxID=151549 RepID=A0A4C1VXM2_EUMVA|nr:hypothetical protein EVAR_21949_1 [Eumeta japonica]